MSFPDNASTIALASTQTFVITGFGAILLDQRVISLLMAIFAFISLLFQIYFRYKEYKVKVRELELKHGHSAED